MYVYFYIYTYTVSTYTLYTYIHIGDWIHTPRYVSLCLRRAPGRPPPRSWLQNLLKFAEAFQGKEAILAWWAQWDVADIHGIFVGTSGH